MLRFFRCFAVATVALVQFFEFFENSLPSFFYFLVGGSGDGLDIELLFGGRLPLRSQVLIFLSERWSSWTFLGDFSTFSLPFFSIIQRGASNFVFALYLLN